MYRFTMVWRRYIFLKDHNAAPIESGTCIAELVAHAGADSASVCRAKVPSYAIKFAIYKLRLR